LQYYPEIASPQAVISPTNSDNRMNNSQAGIIAGCIAAAVFIVSNNPTYLWVLITDNFCGNSCIYAATIRDVAQPQAHQ